MRIRIFMTALTALCASNPVWAQNTTIGAIATGGPSTQTQAAQVLTVDRDADDGKTGSLRWAIETANSDPGKYSIDIVSSQDKPLHIVLQRAIPAIKGPLVITGTAWARNGTYAVVDGSGYLPRDLKSCPGVTDGQYGTNIRTMSNPGFFLEDTNGVKISGLDIRNFCIGILVLRSSNNTFADNRIVRNIGGAGIMITGDDGKGGSTSDTALDNKVLRNDFYENGDALELTRGAAFNLIADNVFDAGQDNLEPSQGIEILWGNDNTVVQNRFVNYTDGLQLNWGSRNYIGANVMQGNAFGISVTGQDNMIVGNDIRDNGIGIAVRPEKQATANRISKNTLVGNGQPILRCSAGGSCDPNLPRGAIVFGVPGLEHVEYVGSRGMGVVQDKSTAPHICTAGAAKAGCQDAPELGQLPPVLTNAVVDGDKVKVVGSANGPANTFIQIEVFASLDGTNDATSYLGTIDANTDADGISRFEGVVSAPNTKHAVVANLTTAQGASSEFSSAIAIE